LTSPIEVLTPVAAIENPRVEAALGSPRFCFVIASVLQFAAIYQS
jgi:hypothetical protein